MTDGDALAARWFGVRGEFEMVGRWHMAVRSAREFFLHVLTLSSPFLGDFDPKRFCDVVVFRRDTNESVARYPYERLSDATVHVVDLRARLLSVDVFDFCRQLSLSIDLVQGPGHDVALDPAEPWIGVASSARLK